MVVISQVLVGILMLFAFLVTEFVPDPEPILEMVTEVYDFLYNLINSFFESIF